MLEPIRNISILAWVAVAAMVASLIITGVVFNERNWDDYRGRVVQCVQAGGDPLECQEALK